MISFLRKTAPYCLILFFVSFLHVSAANYDSEISTAKEQLNQDLRTNSELYPNYSEQGKAIVDTFIQDFENDALDQEKTTNKNSNYFISQVIDYENAKLKTIADDPATSLDLKTIILTTRNTTARISNKIANAELSSELGGSQGAPSGSGGVVLSGNASQPTTTQTKADKPNPCGLLGFFTFECADYIIGKLIESTLVNLALGIFYLCGAFLHITIDFGLLSLKDLIKDGGIYDLWLFTLKLVLTGALFSTFYFIGMYLVGLGKSVVRASVAVILLSIFASFSFSIATGAIDLSNMITTSVYTSISPDWQQPSSWTSPTIVTAFKKRLGYSSGPTTFSGVDKDSILSAGPGSAVATNLLLAASMIYNSYILLMMGLLFLVRDLGFVFGIIFSPLLLIDQAIPKLSDIAKKFRTFFFGQLMVGPVFMLLMYIGLRVIDVMTSGIKSSGLPQSNFGVIFFTLAAVSAVFHMAYKLCKQLSGDLGNFATSTLGGIAQKAMIATPLGVASRMGSLALRNTVGRAGQWASNRLENSSARKNFFGDSLFKAAKYAGYDATYDLRNSTVVANAQKKFTGATGMSNEGGYFGSGNAGVSYNEAKKSATEKLRKDLAGYESVEDENLRNELMEGRTRGKYLRGFGGTGKIDPNDDKRGDARRVFSPLSGKEKAEELARAQRGATAKKDGLTQENRTKYDDKVASVPLDNIFKKDDTVKKSAVKEIDTLLTDLADENDKTREYVVPKLKKAVIREIMDGVKTSEKFDPLDKDFVTKAMDQIVNDMVGEAGYAKVLKLDDHGVESTEVENETLRQIKAQLQSFATQRKKEYVDAEKAQKEYAQTDKAKLDAIKSLLAGATKDGPIPLWKPSGNEAPSSPMDRSTPPQPQPTPSSATSAGSAQPRPAPASASPVGSPQTQSANQSTSMPLAA